MLPEKCVSYNVKIKWGLVMAVNEKHNLVVYNIYLQDKTENCQLVTCKNYQFVIFTG